MYHAPVDTCRGMCHTGFDAVLHSLEHKLLLEGRKLHTDFLQHNHLPYKDVGAIMVAWNEEEVKKRPFYMLPLLIVLASWPSGGLLDTKTLKHHPSSYPNIFVRNFLKC